MLRRLRSLRRVVRTSALPLVAAGAVALFAVGCEREETILDVDGPDGGGVEINETTDLDGDRGLEVEVD